MSWAQRSVHSTDLSDGQEIETLLGENVNVSITADGVFMNNAQASWRTC